MPMPNAGRSDQAHRLTTELQLLRDRLNHTIDQLCSLVAGGEIAQELIGLSELTTGEAGAASRHLVPAWLKLPMASAHVSSPTSGHRLSPDTGVYSDYRNGLMQLIQSNLPRGEDERYGLVINHADFDGTFFSLVVDARSLLADLPAGQAKLAMSLDLRGTPAPAIYAKCTWKVGEDWQERPLKLRANHASADSVTVDGFDPSQVQALDFHLIFNPVGRGSFEIRRFSVSLLTTPPVEAPLPVSVFESNP